MHVGRILIIAGIVFIALGVLAIIMSRSNLPLGRLPGDVVWRGKNSTVYIPWVTCLLLSVLASLLLWLISRRG